jgi:hypothetical protein
MIGKSGNGYSLGTNAKAFALGTNAKAFARGSCSNKKIPAAGGGREVGFGCFLVAIRSDN